MDFSGVIVGFLVCFNSLHFLPLKKTLLKSLSFKFLFFIQLLHPEFLDIDFPSKILSQQDPSILSKQAPQLSSTFESVQEPHFLSLKNTLLNSCSL